MSKDQLLNGFYRLWLQSEDTHRLAVADQTKPDLIGTSKDGIPSPPNFSAHTELVVLFNQSAFT